MQGKKGEVIIDKLAHRQPDYQNENGSVKMWKETNVPLNIKPTMIITFPQDVQAAIDILKAKQDH
jgi:hypothetical protein